MVSTPDARLHRRAGELLRHSHSGRLVLLGAVAAIVLLNTFVDGAIIFQISTGEQQTVRAWIAISLALTALINVIVLVLMWMMFETLARVERESDRLQTFMDTMYRKVR